MSYLTERKLSNTLDVPVNLPTTEIKMADWVVIATIKLTAPTRLTYRMMNFSFASSTFDVTKLQPVNLIVPNFGLCYVGLFRNYVAGDPASLPAVDAVAANALGVAVRSGAAYVTDEEATYSWIAVNNIQFNAQNTNLGVTDSADFTLCATGQARLELDLTQ